MQTLLLRVNIARLLSASVFVRVHLRTQSLSLDCGRATAERFRSRGNLLNKPDASVCF